jgi:hypothetical protein
MIHIQSLWNWDFVMYPYWKKLMFTPNSNCVNKSGSSCYAYGLQSAVSQNIICLTYVLAEHFILFMLICPLCYSDFGSMLLAIMNTFSKHITGSFLPSHFFKHEILCTGSNVCECFFFCKQCKNEVKSVTGVQE